MGHPNGQRSNTLGKTHRCLACRAATTLFAELGDAAGANHFYVPICAACERQPAQVQIAAQRGIAMAAAVIADIERHQATEGRLPGPALPEKH